MFTKYQNGFFWFLWVGILHVLRWVALAVKDVTVVDVFCIKRMQAVIADESLTVVFRSAGNQVGHVFDPHIVAGIVWSFK